jgi:hypothetical protein
MRELAHGSTPDLCQKQVTRYISRGWKQVSEIKLDDSGSGYNEIRYVAVMEFPEKEGAPKKQRNWGRRWHL